MLRRTLFGLTLALLTSLATNTARADVMIQSDTFTMSAVNDEIRYDFSADPNKVFITPTSTLIGIEALYTFLPPAEGAGIQPLKAGLKIPFTGGVDSGVGFNLLVDMSKGSSGYATNYAFDGLAFSQVVIDEFFAPLADIVTAQLAGDASDLIALSNFFEAGGQLQTQLRLITNDNPDGGGGQVPEPASLMVWGSVGLLAYAVRRKLVA